MGNGGGREEMGEVGNDNGGGYEKGMGGKVGEDKGSEGKSRI